MIGLITLLLLIPLSNGFPALVQKARTTSLSVLASRYADQSKGETTITRLNYWVSNWAVAEGAMFTPTERELAQTELLWIRCDEIRDIDQQPDPLLQAKPNAYLQLIAWIPVCRDVTVGGIFLATSDADQSYGAYVRQPYPLSLQQQQPIEYKTL